MLRRVGIALVACWLPVAPAAAYHDATYADRARYCATRAYSVVEALVTYGEGMEPAAAAIVRTPIGPDGLRVLDVVEDVTGAGLERALSNFEGCIESIEADPRPDAAAFLAVQAIEVEVGLGLEQLHDLDDKIDAQMTALRDRLGQNAPVTQILGGYRSYATDVRTSLQELQARVVRLGDQTRM